MNQVSDFIKAKSIKNKIFGQMYPNQILDVNHTHSLRHSEVTWRQLENFRQRFLALHEKTEKSCSDTSSPVYSVILSYVDVEKQPVFHINMHRYSKFQCDV